MKTMILNRQEQLPFALRSLVKLQHGQIHFEGLWNGTLGESSDLQARIEVLDRGLLDLIFKNGVLGAAEGYIRGYWRSHDLVQLIQILARNRDVLDKINQNPLAQVSQQL